MLEPVEQVRHFQSADVAIMCMLVNKHHSPAVSKRTNVLNYVSEPLVDRDDSVIIWKTLCARTLSNGQYSFLLERGLLGLRT